MCGYSEQLHTNRIAKVVGGGKQRFCTPIRCTKSLVGIKSITFCKKAISPKKTAVSFGDDSGNIHKGLKSDRQQAFFFLRTGYRCIIPKMNSGSIHRALLYLRVSSQSKDSGIYNRTARNTAILRGLMSKGVII